jgi:hypothetical protein
MVKRDRKVENQGHPQAIHNERLKYSRMRFENSCPLHDVEQLKANVTEFVLDYSFNGQNAGRRPGNSDYQAKEAKTWPLWWI